MRKNIWLSIGVFVSCCAGAGLLYANHHAEQLMAGYIEQANQQYQQMAEQGDIPPVQLSYSALSANVLTSSYTIADLHVSLVGVGDFVTVGEVELIGFQSAQLPKEGAAKLTDLKLAPAVLASFPADLADYLAGLLLDLNYQYHYKAATGELTFQQELSIDNRFSLNYRFGLTGVTELWRFAEELQKLTPEQQQQQAEQPDYLPDLMKKVGGIGIATGAFELKNDAFVQQLFDRLAQSQITDDYATTQQQLSAALQHNPQIPEQFRQAMLSFVQQPKSLKLQFKFQHPPTFAQMQDGSAMAGIETADDFITYAGLTLVANSD